MPSRIRNECLSFLVIGLCAHCGEAQQTATLAAPPVANSPAIQFTQESLEAIKKSVDEKRAILIDVRSDREWKTSHLKEALHISMKTLADEELRRLALDALDKSQPIYIHCMVGARAKTATSQLIQLGFDARAIGSKFGELSGGGFTLIHGKAK